jgi:hypothetical protein
MDSGIASLIGVVVGSSLTLGKDWLMLWKKDRKDLVLLAIQVAAQLEKFAADCASVAGDDGEEDEHGMTHTSVASPKFDVKAHDVEWKVVRPDLLLKILDLPYQVELADGAISVAADFADAPDYWEYFEERQYQYAGLGIGAAELAAELRRVAKIQGRPRGKWDPVVTMMDKRTAIEARRRKRESSGLHMFDLSAGPAEPVVPAVPV